MQTWPIWYIHSTMAHSFQLQYWLALTNLHLGQLNWHIIVILFGWRPLVWVWWANVKSGLPCHIEICDWKVWLLSTAVQYIFAAVNQISTLTSCVWSCRRLVGYQFQHQLFGGHLWRVVILWRRYVTSIFYNFSSSNRSHQWQLSHVAIKQSTVKQAEFATRIGTYETNQLIFVDESIVDRHTTYRGRTWAICGRKAMCKAFFVAGKGEIIASELFLLRLTHFFDIGSQSFPLYPWTTAYFTVISLRAHLILNFSICSSAASWIKCSHSQRQTQSLSWITARFINILIS